MSKQSKDIIKDGLIDISKVLDANGMIDRQKAEEMIREFPITPTQSPTTMKYSIKANRVRKPLPDRLPTQGLDPLPIDEHEFIGLYESKQNLYLIIAHAYNRIMDRLDKIEKNV